MKTRYYYVISWAAVVFYMLLLGARLAAQDLTIGLSLPLSGGLQEFGEAARNGIELARRDDPESFKSIKFIYEDNRYDGKTAIGNLHKFRETNRADLMYVFTDVPALAVSALADKLSFPLIAGSTIPLASKQDSFYLRFLNSYADYATALGEYLADRGYRSVALMVADDPYYLGYAQVLERVLGARGVKTRSYSSTADSLDFRSALPKIASQHPEIVGVLLSQNQIKAVFKQMRAVNLNFKVFGTDDFESNSLLADARGLMEGAPYALHEVDRAFVSRYRQVYGNDIFISYAASAYEFARSCGKLQKALPVPRGADSLMRAFKQSVSGPGVLGPVELRWSEENGSYVHFPVVIKVVRGGERERVSRNGAD